MPALRWLRTEVLCATLLVAALGCAGAQEEVEEPLPVQAQASPLESFHDELAPYGQWIELPDVGWVWRPAASVVGPDFVPYATGGQWMYDDDYGWTFQTAWTWGWAPFHYGRWFISVGYGWVWWPDTVWGPAWVDWRSGDGFIGWNPLPPPSITVAPAWSFVRTPDFVRPGVRRFVLPPREATGVLPRTAVVGARRPLLGQPWSRGPDATLVERATGRPAPRVELTRPPHAPSPEPRQGRASMPPSPRPPSHEEPSHAPAPRPEPEHVPSPRPEHAPPHHGSSPEHHGR